MEDNRNNAFKQLQQEGVIAETLTNGNSAWTVVYDSFDISKGHYGGRYAAFAQPDQRDKILGRAEWDFSKGDGRPCFSQTVVDGEDVVKYYRSYEAPQFEPIIILQEFDGVVPDSLLVSEEFRLLMNLWQDPKTGNFYAINNDGSKDLAIRFKGEKVEVRTPILRRYQAARQLDLVLFTDSILYVKPHISSEDLQQLETESQTNDGMAYVSRYVDAAIGADYSAFSRVLAKRLLPPPPQETCGIWPWEDNPDYPEFVIAEDEFGKPVRYTCNPDELANYFGSNPDAPHYLTPVFFKPEVLQRYYDDPDIYEVRDGYLSCAAKWGVEIDNGNPEVVSVFLGDIGQKIPPSHWPHWQAHNIPPVQKMSETNIRRSFLNQWAESENPEHQFKHHYQRLQEYWARTWGWRLHREPAEHQAGLIHRLRIPLNETDAEFKAQILNLALLLVDPLNEKELSKHLDNADKNVPGISKFEQFLQKHNYAHTERDIVLLRKIQTMRSRVVAHDSGSRGQEYLESELAGTTRQRYVSSLLEDATQMIIGLMEAQPLRDE